MTSKHIQALQLLSFKNHTTKDTLSMVMKQENSVQQSLFFALAFSQSLQPEVWTTKQINYILDQGTELYKSINIPRYLEAHELPTLVAVEQTFYCIELSYCEQGILNCQRSIYFINCLRDGFNRSSCLLLWVGHITLSLMKTSTYFFLLDSHSRDENGYVANEGTYVLLRFLHYHDTTDYITSTYLANAGNNELIFEIQCATISEVGDPSQTSFGVSYNVVTLQSSASFPSCQSKQVHLDRFNYQQTPILQIVVTTFLQTKLPNVHAILPCSLQLQRNRRVSH